MRNGGDFIHPLMARAFALRRHVASALRTRRERATVAAVPATEADVTLELVAAFLVGVCWGADAEHTVLFA